MDTECKENRNDNGREDCPEEEDDEMASSSEDEGDEDSDNELNDSQDDDWNESGMSYDENDDSCEEPEYEGYQTTLDGNRAPVVNELQVFRFSMKTIKNNDNDRYGKILASLSEKNRKALKEQFAIADEKIKEEGSKGIETNASLQFVQNIRK